ncbi:hypothetical protein MHU86_4019 [Fragilaria crotonensis]|nr:hypothetical protein MHU86_4019 [Fragilaria crotonensis]
MDLLKKEMERKKMALSLARDKTSSGRFVKASDLRRAQEEEEERLRHKRPRLEANPSIAASHVPNDTTITTDGSGNSTTTTPPLEETAFRHDGKEGSKKMPKPRHLRHSQREKPRQYPRNHNRIQCSTAAATAVAAL